MSAVLVAEAVMHIFLGDSRDQPGHGYVAPARSRAAAQLFKYHPAFIFTWESPLPACSLILSFCRVVIKIYYLKVSVPCLQPATPTGDHGIWQPLPVAGYGAGELQLGSYG